MVVHCRERKKKIGGWRLLTFMNDLLSIVWLQKIIVEYPQLLYFIQSTTTWNLFQRFCYTSLSLYIYIHIHIHASNKHTIRTIYVLKSYSKIVPTVRALQ